MVEKERYVVRVKKSGFEEKIILTGESGKKYLFLGYPRKFDLDKIGAVYLVSRMYKNAAGKTLFKKIYFGETDSLLKRFASHEKEPCFKQYKSNYIFFHKVENERHRLDIESDLINNYKTPCNKEN